MDITKKSKFIAKNWPLNLVSLFETSLKWLTVAMPILETIERQERDKRETRKRDNRETRKRDKRETRKRDKRETRERQKRD